MNAVEFTLHSVFHFYADLPGVFGLWLQLGTHRQEVAGPGHHKHQRQLGSEQRMKIATSLRFGILGVVLAGSVSSASADDFLVADGKAWPGKLLVLRGNRTETYLDRTAALPEGAITRVQSVTALPNGRIVFCSGLDRYLMEAQPAGERVFQHGGYLARQVRADRNGQVYWSGLETPRDGAPLPDGFIYTWDSTRNETRTVLTFSQGDVGRDWWGAFDVRDGRIYVATLRDKSRIYEIVNSVPRRVAELPFSVTAIRFDQDGSLCACDGQGGLYRFPDLTDPAHYTEVARSRTPFVDFAAVNVGP